MKKLLLFLDKHIELILISVSIAIICIVMFLQVIMRYVFNNALSWPEEVLVYFNIWNAFIGCSYAMRHKSEMRIDFVNMLPKVPRIIIERIAEMILIAFYFYIIQCGSEVTANFYVTGQKSAAAGVPMFLVYVSFVVGAYMSVLRYVQRLIIAYRQWKKGRDAGEGAHT